MNSIVSNLFNDRTDSGSGVRIETNKETFGQISEHKSKLIDFVGVIVWQNELNDRHSFNFIR